MQSPVGSDSEKLGCMHLQCLIGRLQSWRLIKNCLSKWSAYRSQPDNQLFVLDNVTHQSLVCWRTPRQARGPPYLDITVARPWMHLMTYKSVCNVICILALN